MSNGWIIVVCRWIGVAHERALTVRLWRTSRQALNEAVAVTLAMNLRLHLRGLFAPQFDGLSRAAAVRLVSSLFDQASLSAVGAVAIGLVGVTAYTRTGSIWFLVWLGLQSAVVVGRLGLTRAWHRRDNADAPEVWARRFMVGAWVSGALWASTSAVIVLRNDPELDLLVIATLTGWSICAAARLGLVRSAARGHLLLVLGPLFVACVTCADPFYRVLAGLVVLASLAGLTTIRFVYENTTGLLLANEATSALNRRLENLAMTDRLTAIANRRGFDIRLAQAWWRSVHERQPLSLLLLDVDHFKSFNDLYGHRVGDRCLRQVAEAMKQTIRRPHDFAARYGGEEFAVILMHTEVEDAVRVAERVRAAIEALGIPHAGNLARRVTASIGIATIVANGSDPGVLVSLADAALYQAKRRGRNQVWCDGDQAAAGGLARAGLVPLVTRLPEVFSDALQNSGERHAASA